VSSDHESVPEFVRPEGTMLTVGGAMRRVNSRDDLMEACDEEKGRMTMLERFLRESVQHAPATPSLELISGADTPVKVPDVDVDVHGNAAAECAAKLSLDDGPGHRTQELPAPVAVRKAKLPVAPASEESSPVRANLDGFNKWSQVLDRSVLDRALAAVRKHRARRPSEEDSQEDRFSSPERTSGGQHGPGTSVPARG
jgi:hypothetical protein